MQKEAEKRKKGMFRVFVGLFVFAGINIAIVTAVVQSPFCSLQRCVEVAFFGQMHRNSATADIKESLFVASDEV
jgi:hypothetical protein